MSNWGIPEKKKDWRKWRKIWRERVVDLKLCKHIIENSSLYEIDRHCMLFEFNQLLEVQEAIYMDNKTFKPENW